jgi:hypothetical protein
MQTIPPKEMPTGLKLVEIECGYKLSNITEKDSNNIKYYFEKYFVKKVCLVKVIDDYNIKCYITSIIQENFHNCYILYKECNVEDWIPINQVYSIQNISISDEILFKLENEIG